jgi:hypothetical protein
MRAGVLGSNCLLLVLTKGVLFRPYCIAEVYEAIKAGKRIVLVSEEDPRSPVRWDFAEWQKHWDISGVAEVEAEVVAKQLELASASAATDWDRVTQLGFELTALKKQQATKTSDYDWCRKELEADVFEKTPAGAQRAMDAVRDMIVANKDEIVPFRRRKFESDAMLAEIFKRCGLYTELALRPTLHVAGARAADAQPLARHNSQHFTHDVAVIWTPSGEVIKASLCAALEADGLSIADGTAPGGLDHAIRVLVVLTEGTATDPAAAAAIRHALDLGRHLVGVMDCGPRAGWEAVAAASAAAAGGLSRGLSDPFFALTAMLHNIGEHSDGLPHKIMAPPPLYRRPGPRLAVRGPRAHDVPRAGPA